MENNKRSDFIDVYILKTLNEIKNKVTWNIKLDKKRMEETDEKMSILLRELIDSNFKNLQRDPKGNLIYTLLPIVDEKENEKVRLSLVLYYTALYYDNVELLHELLKADVIFEQNYSIYLQYLDSSVSSKFDRDQYVKYIKTFGETFKSFVKSIEKLSEEEREKYISRFARLVNLKYEHICEYLKNAKRYDNLEHLFDKNNLDTFEDDSYRLADDKQLQLINQNYGCSHNEDTCARLNNLIQTSSFSNQLCDFDLMMKLYTDEELTTLGRDVSLFLNYFSKSEEMLQKAIKFIEIRPDLALAGVCISREQFMKVSNYVLFEALDHMEKRYIIVNEHNLSISTKTMAPKATIKKIFGAYNKRNS